MSRHSLCIVLLTIAAASGRGLFVSDAVAAPTVISCRPCPLAANVILMIGLPSSDHRASKMTQLWMERHSLMAQQRQREGTGETIPVITSYPADIDDFRQQVQRIADQCMRVASLGIMSHGNLGYLQIGSDGVSVRNIDDAFGHGLGCVMSPRAFVEIGGCNVGRGCRGSNFMLAAASRLLQGGGRIVAPESYVYGNAFLGIAPRSILGDRVLELDAAASGPRWIRGGEPGFECSVQTQESRGNRGSGNAVRPAH